MNKRQRQRQFKAGDTFIIHDRWKEEYFIAREEHTIPQWTFPFPFGVTYDWNNCFLLRHIGCLARIKSYDEDSFSCWLEFFCEEYTSLPEDEKDMVKIDEKDIPVFLDPIDTTNVEEMLRVEP